MKKQVSNINARRILAKVPVEVSFWLCTNEQLRSLNELSDALKRANEDVFRYHVNRDKNDFEVWIRETVKDKELAREISRIKTRFTLIRKLGERVEELRKMVKKAAPKKEKRKARKKAWKKAKKIKKATKRKQKKAAKKKARKSKKRRR